MRACPVCNQPFELESRQGVPMDVCATHGIWLDQKELLAITEAERLEQGRFTWSDLFRRPMSPPSDPGRVLSCPICREDMSHELYADVHIDWCPNHGVWLDNGELDAILNNLRLDPTYLRGLALRISDARL